MSWHIVFCWSFCNPHRITFCTNWQANWEQTCKTCNWTWFNYYLIFCFSYVFAFLSTNPSVHPVSGPNRSSIDEHLAQWGFFDAVDDDGEWWWLATYNFGQRLISNQTRRWIISIHMFCDSSSSQSPPGHKRTEQRSATAVI